MEQWRPIPPVPTLSSEDPHFEGWKRTSRTAVLGRQISHLRGTAQWLGWGRILTVIISVPLVGWGTYFLLRSPAPPIEASLSYATTVPVAASGTLTSETGSMDSAVSGPVLVTVHVAGHVRSPGVYRFSPGVRAVDAVRAAGGATQDADLNAVNLAGPLADGQQIYIPAMGERTPGGAIESGTATASTAPSLPIDLNRASAEELDILPGIGPSTAAAIVTHRDRNGPFVSVQGLLDVPGIGPAKLEALAGLITV